MVDPDMQALVIENGSGMMKCGFSGDDAPRAVFPTIVGRPKNPGIMVGMDAKDCFVGDEAQAKRGILNNRCPIPNDGSGYNMNDLEKIYHHTFYNELSVTPEEHPLLLTSLNYPGGKRRLNLEKSTSMMFETFNVPALYISDAPVCSLYASGRTIGTVLDIGDGKTSAVSIYEGLPVQSSRIDLEDQMVKKPRKRIGGSLITDVLARLLKSSGKLSCQTRAELEIVRDIKEKLGFVSLNKIPNLVLENVENEYKKKQQEGNKNRNKNENKILDHEYELPDGSVFTVGQERCIPPEILFKPSLVGYDLPGIHKLVQCSIDQCHSDMKHTLYSNIVLTGGSTMFEGIVERLESEIKEINDYYYSSTDKYFVKVNAPAERKFSAWIGGSILSSLSTFQNMWITKDEYDDAGATIFNRKCQDTTNRNDQIGLFIPQFRKDPDKEERLEYILEECFVGRRRRRGSNKKKKKKNDDDDVFEDEDCDKAEFSIKLFNLDVEIRFKSFIIFG